MICSEKKGVTKISSKLGTVDQKNLSNQKCILQHCSIHTEVAFAASIELYAFVIRYNIINPGAEEVKIHSVATNGPKTSKAEELQSAKQNDLNVMSRCN